MTSRRKSVPTEALARPPDKGRKADILLLGLNNHEARTLPSRLFGALAGGTVEVPLDALSASRLENVMAILSPIVSPEFDAVDVAARLSAEGFTGRYIAYAAEVTHADLIRAEVEAVAPGIAFDIVTMGHGPRLAAN